MSKTPLLLETVRQASRARALSRKTENAYVNQIRRFQNFCAERDLNEVGDQGVSDFLNYLSGTENLAASTRNQALSALAFLYRDVLGRELLPCLKAAKRIKPAAKAPVVFSPEEARGVLAKMRGETFLVAALMYGSGLRLSEAVALRVGDIDFERREIVVRDVQSGKRDRVTILPVALIPALRKHLRQVRFLYEDDCLLGYGSVHVPRAIERQSSAAAFEWRWQFAFPSHNLTIGTDAHRFHLAESTVQKAVAEAILKAKIIKQACCQTLRYSFAARLFEKNCDVRRIQALLGHKNLKSTLACAQSAARRQTALRSPLDS